MTEEKILWEEDLGEVLSINLSALYELADFTVKILDDTPDKIAIVRLRFYYAPNGNNYTVDVKVPAYWSKREINEYLDKIWTIAEMF